MLQNNITRIVTINVKTFTFNNKAMSSGNIPPSKKITFSAGNLHSTYIKCKVWRGVDCVVRGISETEREKGETTRP